MWRFFFGFEGRVDRGRFWVVVVTATLLFSATGVLPLMTGPSVRGPGTEIPILLLVLSAVGWIVAMFSVVTRRLHDLDQSAWWLVAIAFALVPAIIVLGCWEGRPGPNRFGPDPRDPGTVVSG
jgi:uncharacterized membrane protein YhaH (DUF805 family)